MRIAQLRDARGLSQKQLRDELEKAGLDVRRETVTQWENGTRDLKTEYTIKLAEFFNVSADYLLGLSEAPTKNKTIQGVSDLTGLWVDAIAMLKTKKSIGDYEAASFLSFLAVHEDFPRLVTSIQQRNTFSEEARLAVDLNGEQRDLKMRELYKLIVSDFFLE